MKMKKKEGRYLYFSKNQLLISEEIQLQILKNVL